MPDETRWQLLPPYLQPDIRFQMALLVAAREIYDRHFARDPMANPALGFHIHGYRRSERWRILLLITPWMLSRLLFPERPPRMPIPDGWSAEQREGAGYQMLGPSVELRWRGEKLKAHLNYHPCLGHYLLQPIALNMQNYTTPGEAIRAWSDVIKVRDKNMQRMQRDCPWQREISRREFLGGVRDKE